MNGSSYGGFLIIIGMTGILVSVYLNILLYRTILFIAIGISSLVLFLIGIVVFARVGWTDVKYFDKSGFLKKAVSELSIPAAIYSVRTAGSRIILTFDNTDTIDADLLLPEYKGLTFIYTIRQDRTYSMCTVRKGEWKCLPVEFRGGTAHEAVLSGFKPKYVNAFVMDWLSENGFFARTSRFDEWRSVTALRKGLI